MSWFFVFFAFFCFFGFFWSPRGRPHFPPSSLSRFLCLHGRRWPLSGCHVSSSDTCRWHFPEIRVPKQDTLFNPKFVATRPKAIQNEILPTNPCVEHFTHSPYILKSVGLTARQLAFLAFVVAPVELIYDEVLDVLKMSSSKTGCRTQGSEAYWV